jgi:hypothetical protein
MKTTVRGGPRRPLTRSAARNYALINQLGTPGLGSVLAGRWLMGSGQLLLFLAGFGMFVAWFVLFCIEAYRQIKGGPEAKSVAWLGEVGALTCAVAWLWTLFTSLSLLREARANEHPPALPRL